ncbi:hypothetical protein TNCV_2965151 [Trichonephila clavipes]|nr:hypothetical protein TNCV_2965151 [Trichonephila clavipes]
MHSSKSATSTASAFVLKEYFIQIPCKVPKTRLSISRQSAYLGRTLAGRKNRALCHAKIIAVVTINEKIPENDEDINVVDTVQTPNISHRKGLKAVKTTLQYFEQPSASVIDLLYLRRLRNKAEKCRVQYERHTHKSILLSSLQKSGQFSQSDS